MGAESKVIAVALAEVGYLEKRSNSNLESKTANAGSNNYTKYGAYWGHNGPDAYWCDYWVDWDFCQAYGREKAKKLLGGFSGYTPTSAQYFRNMGRYYTKNPKAGDVIFFKNSERICHTGIVYKVSGGVVYTIEGNTSGASGVVANGGGVCKKSYSLSNSRIAGYGRPDYSIVTDKEDNNMGQWIESNGRWWYKHADGNYTRDSWEQIEGQWYHFDAQGWMQTGWLNDNGTWYWLCGKGCMETGWQSINGEWYFMDASGKMRTGWIQDNANWYYLNTDGKMATGWLQLGDTWYYLYDSGIMATGLIDVAGKLYYLAGDGHLCYTDASGWLR